MIAYLIRLLLVDALLTVAAELDSPCTQLDACQFVNDTTFGRFIKCNGFSNWSALTQPSNCSIDSLDHFDSIESTPRILVWPATRLVLNSDFDLNSIEALGADLSSPNRQIFFKIVLLNLAGFEVTFDVSSPTRDYVLLTVENSNLEFYHKNERISDCNASMGEWIGSNRTLFNTIQALSLSTSVRLSTRACPLVFMNAHLAQMSINGLVSHFIMRNEFQFVSGNLGSVYETLNSTITEFYVSGFELRVDAGLIDEKVFAALTVLTLAGTVQCVDAVVFRSLINLQRVVLNLNSFMNFVHGVIFVLFLLFL
jgi:hypothetical protein